MKLYKRSILFFLVLALAAIQAHSQELNCKVRVMHEKIVNTDPQVFVAMERGITEFLNSRKWTTDEFGVNEKIDCNILINLLSHGGDDPDLWSATLSIQATRPVFNSSYTSPMVNFIDKDIVFKFNQFTTLQFDDNHVSGSDAYVANLTAILAYYSYLVIGLDYDSFAPSGGSVWLKRSQNIVSNAPEQGKSISGWKAVEGNYNRYWIIDELLNPRFQALRTYWYSLHREGLDNMYVKPSESRVKILSGLNSLNQINKENPGSVLMQFFFDAKSDELSRMVAQLPRDERITYINLLNTVDVPDAAKYNSLK